MLISHRGNINNKISKKENTVSYINEALNNGYYVEIDVWYENKKWYLGHDNPTTEIDFCYIDNDKFFIHAKNDAALYMLHSNNTSADFFWHENDSYTLTSKNNIWVYVGKSLIPNSICVLPEQQITGDLKICKGVCSDFISTYKNIL